MIASLQASVASLAWALETRQKKSFLSRRHSPPNMARQTFSKCTEEQRVSTVVPNGQQKTRVLFNSIDNGQGSSFTAIILLFRTVQKAFLGNAELPETA